MPALIEMRTERLRLRQWRGSDREPFAQLNADPVVMEFFPRTLNRKESDTIADRMQALIAANGWGFWAVELLESAAFIGVVGLNAPSSSLPCWPCIEVGWRLAQPYWGKGYACEAAGASLRLGFEVLNLTEIVSFTAVGNLRSQRVMHRLGMHRDDEDFEHPDVPAGHALRLHALYRLPREVWNVQAPSRYVDLR
ncbi:MAG: GCN5-related N-acetyltransferase [Herbaspirillum sp.]|jgi:RimJ/RimL family protein N-acetyltransferase|nr:GCN5-related N-acetyltransferase [Herbaspirillum sp.]